MKLKMPHFDAVNRHCPDAIKVLRRYYSDDAGEMQIRGLEVNAHDLLDAKNSLTRCMETLLNTIEQEGRDFTADEQQCFDALTGWCDRFQQKYDLEKPLNPLPSEHRTYQTDVNGLVSIAQGNGGQLHRDAPLTREQRFSDWVTQYGNEPDPQGLTLGDCVRAWITGEHSALTRRTLSSTGNGGILIPSVLSANIIDLARNKCRVMQAGAVTWPMSSNNLTVPRQTGDPQAGWRPELGPIKRTGLTFEPLVLKACSLGALVTLSRELVEDAVGLDAFLTRILSQVMAEGLDFAALAATGATDAKSKERIEPTGMLNTSGVQEIAHNAKLTSYAPFSQAVTQVRQVNGEPSGLMMAPNNFGILDALTDTTGQPLRPPESWSQVSRYETNQLDGNTAVIGDWSQLAIGLRQNVQLEHATAGSIPADSEGVYEELNLFSQNALAIRVLWRGDVGIKRPDQFVKITGLNPAKASAKAKTAA